MEARDRKLKDWFNRIRSGQLRLPRFQRGEEWTSNEVDNLLTSVFRDLPAGAALILEVGDEEPFVSRPMVGAPDPRERAVEHLLDGQQRLTALWRSMHDNYEKHSYFVELPAVEEEELEIEVVTRWVRRGQRYPVWADSPGELLRRRLVPLKLFRPEDIGSELREWCDAAAGADLESRELELKIQTIRSRVAEYNIPFLSLPTRTPKHVALDVFVKMNTSFVKLTPFDIIVAQVEAATEMSLLDLVTELRSAVPEIDSYTDPSELVLSIAALRHDLRPAQTSYFNLDLNRLVAEWDAIVAGVGWLVEVLTEEKVFDGARLPTVAVLPVIAALNDAVPTSLDERGNARRLMRKYAWRSFLTDRYGSTAATHAFQDLRALRAVLDGSAGEDKVPIFDSTNNPYPTSPDDLLRLRWPKERQILARGTLAVALKGGALDIADASTVSRVNLGDREYHHLFPANLLSEDGKLTKPEVYQALNCALITWKTNRNISAKEPLKYLAERTRRRNLGETLGQQEARQRLASHLIPYDELAVGGYVDLPDGTRAAKIKEDYEMFLRARAAMMLEPISTLCEGGIYPAIAT